jgi:hypothetical protein
MALTGTKMTHVPYKGTAPVLTDLIAGNVDLTFIFGILRTAQSRPRENSRDRF